MSYYGNFSVHKVVEPNQSTGLRTGHMVAQTKFLKGELQADSLDNGYILALDVVENKLKLSDGTEETLFMHFTEEHMPIFNHRGLKYFSVPFMKGAAEDGSEDYCYPRAIAIYTNDTWTTDNFDGTLPTAGTYGQATVADGQLTMVTETNPLVEGQPVFLVRQVTLPNAQTPAGEFIYVGKAGASASTGD